MVLLQFAGIVLACYPVGWVNAGWWVGLLPVVGGTGLGLVTLFHNRIGNFNVYPELREQALLITSGPYRWMRHPMYVALVIMMAGIALYNGHWINAVGVAAVVLAVVLKARREEVYLRQRFPEYAAYAERTRAFGWW